MTTAVVAGGECPPCDVIKVIDSKSPLGYDVPPGPRGVDCRDYDQGLMAHQAAYDPRRFSLFGVQFTVLAGVVTILAQTARIFLNGMGDIDPASGTTGSANLALLLTGGAFTRAETNLEKGGFLVPPAAEGQLTSLQFSPSYITLAEANPPDGIIRPPAAETMVQNAAQIVRAVFARSSVQIDYWEVTGKSETKVLGLLERWAAIDGVNSGMGDGMPNNNAGTGQTRPFPFQLKLHTMGPEERDQDRADNTTFLVSIPGAVIATPAADELEAGAYLLVIRCEATIDLIDALGSRVDRVQNQELAALKAQLATITARLGG